MFTLKDTLGHVFMPLIFSAMLAAFIIAVLNTNDRIAVEADDVQVDDVIIEETAPAITYGPLETNWEPYYGGGSGQDKVITLTDSSLRVVTDDEGGWYGARTEVTESALAEASVSFAYRLSAWEEVERVMFIFSAGEDFENYYGLNLKAYFSNPENNEWHHVVIDTSDFVVIEGDPNWEDITHMAVRVVPKEGVSTRVWFDDFALTKKSERQAVVSFTFDDGFESMTLAKDIMDRQGLVGSAFIIPELLNTEGYMTQSDVDMLHRAGWDISGHGRKNLTLLEPVEVDTELALMYQYLYEHDYQGKEHFAYPNGGYNQSVQSQTMEYFSSARTIDGLQQAPEEIIPQNVNAVTISSSTPVTEIKAEIDQAIENGTWLILVWHELNTDPQVDYDYHTVDFTWIVDYVAEQEVEVLPYSEAYNRFNQ